MSHRDPFARRPLPLPVTTRCARRARPWRRAPARLYSLPPVRACEGAIHGRAGAELCLGEPAPIRYFERSRSDAVGPPGTHACRPDRDRARRRRALRDSTGAARAPPCRVSCVRGRHAPKRRTASGLHPSTHFHRQEPDHHARTLRYLPRAAGRRARNRDAGRRAQDDLDLRLPLPSADAASEHAEPVRFAARRWRLVVAVRRADDESPLAAEIPRESVDPTDAFSEQTLELLQRAAEKAHELRRSGSIPNTCCTRSRTPTCAPRC